MRIGVFSDIHGNIYAFEKIANELRAEQLDILVFCGDICGYYYHQNEIIDILQEMGNVKCVAGNHDKLFLNILKEPSLMEDYERQYGKSNRFLRGTIKDDNLLFLQQLPDFFINDEYALVVFHGSPWDYVNGYVYPDSPFDMFGELPYKFILLGHTHYPLYKCVNNKLIINPGSCGQPRDNNQPSYAILDTTHDTVDFRRISYDIDLMIRDVARHKEDNVYLINVLKREDMSNV